MPTEIALIATLLAGLAGLAYALHYAGYSRAAMGLLVGAGTVVAAMLLGRRSEPAIPPPMLPPEPEPDPVYLRERQTVLDTYAAEVTEVQAATGAAASIDLAKGRGHK